jgi:hypothetical protein
MMASRAGWGYAPTKGSSMTKFRTGVAIYLRLKFWRPRLLWERTFQ